MIVYDQGKYIYIPTMVGPLLTLLQLIASQRLLHLHLELKLLHIDNGHLYLC